MLRHAKQNGCFLDRGGAFAPVREVEPHRSVGLSRVIVRRPAHLHRRGGGYGARCRQTGYRRCRTLRSKSAARQGAAVGPAGGARSRRSSDVAGTGWHLEDFLVESGPWEASRGVLRPLSRPGNHPRPWWEAAQVSSLRATRGLEPCVRLRPNAPREVRGGVPRRRGSARRTTGLAPVGTTSSGADEAAAYQRVAGAIALPPFAVTREAIEGVRVGSPQPAAAPSWPVCSSASE